MVQDVVILVNREGLLIDLFKGTLELTIFQLLFEDGE